jgi:hypothetical protein
MFWNTEQIAFTSAHERTLRALTVDEDGPGTILRDFQSLLAFIRGRDLRATKTYHSIGTGSPCPG